MPDGQNEVLDFFGYDVNAGSPGRTYGPQYERPSYVLENLKWGSPAPGTSGGTIRWAVVSSGSTLPANQPYSPAYTSVGSAFIPTIRAAFARWDAVGNFDFFEVSDPSNADMIVAFDELTSAGSSTIGLAQYYYSGATLQRSYISFDLDRRYRTQDGVIHTVGTSTGSANDLFTLALHEIGHSLGLGHEDDFDTVMNSFQDAVLTDLTSDDISGIRAIYGTPSATPTVDEYPGTVATSATVALGGSITGRIDTTTDEDWFRVTLTAGTNYRIDLRGNDSGSGTLLDPFVRLLNSNGTVLASDDDSGTGTDSQILYAVTSTGIYYISASGFAGEQGTYTLSLATTTQADDYAAGSGTTGALTVGGAVTGRLETNTDADWFAVSLTSGQTYRIDMRGSPSNGGTLADPYVTVRSPSGVLLGSDNNTGTGADAQLTYTAGFTGVHYIEATTLGTGTGTYTVSVINNPVATDDYAATTATTGVAVAGESAIGTIETGGDRDWFRISLTAGATYRFDLRGSPTNAGTLSDPSFVLRDANGTQVAADDDSGTGLDAQLSYSVVTGGTYYVEARSASATATGTYTLGVTITAAADDYIGSILTSGVVTPGGPGTAVSGLIGAAGDTDWFRMTLNAGTPYRFRVINGTLASSHLILRTSDGTSITSDVDGSGNPEIVYTPTSSGTYYLDARAATSTGTGTYTVAADNLSLTDDYGATSATAGAITVGTTATANIGLAGDVDWFRVNLLSGLLYRIDGRGTATGGGTLADPHLTLLNANGVAVLSDTNSGEGADARMFLTAPATATYYVAMRAGSSSATGTYSLLVTANPDDYAATTATTGVTVGGVATGVVETTGDRDWFRTTLTAGLPYTFEVRGTAPGSALRWTESSIVLRDNVGAALRSGTASGLGAAASVAFTPATTGIYYIDALAYNVGVGSYMVSVTSLLGAPAAEAPAIMEDGASSLTASEIARLTAPSAIDLADYGPQASAPFNRPLLSPFADLLAAPELPPEDRHRLEAADLLHRLQLQPSGDPFSLLPTT